MIYDLLIIGGGPAGLTAAIYAKRDLLKIAIYEQFLIGGKLNLTNSVENYPGFKSIQGKNLANRMKEQLDYYQIEIKEEKVLEIKKKKIFILKTEKNVYQSKCVIVASGTKENKLGIEREEFFTNRGIYHCAICEGFLFKESSVAVLGGGYSALETALYMEKIARRVYLIHRKNYFKTEVGIIKKIESKKKIEILLNFSLKKLDGAESLKNLSIENNLTKEIKTLDVKALFPCIGSSPFTGFLHDFKIWNEDGSIRINKNNSTRITGLFAAGDVAREKEDKNKLKQITNAISEGAKAAQSVIRFLK